MNELQRPMFQMPTQNQQPQPMGGITSGLEEAEAVESTEALGGIASGIETLFQNIDNAETPKEIMDAIRGTEASVEERRTELGQLVGKADADKTPESVLTIVQPLMTVIESTGGISDLDTEEAPVAPNIGDVNQMEAMARMQGGENPVMLNTGSPGTVNLQQLQKLASSPIGLLGLAEGYAPKVTPLSELQRQYTDRPSAYEDYSEVLPYQQLAKLGQIIGRSPSLLDAALSPETLKLADPIMQLSLLEAKEKQSRLDKAGDVYKEEVKASAKGKSDIVKPIFAELAKSGFTFSKNEFGDVIAQNARTGEIKVVDQGPGKIIQEDGFIGRITSDPGGGSSLKVMSQKPNIKNFKDDASGVTYLYDTNKQKSDGTFSFQQVGGKTDDQLTAENVVIKEGPGGSVYFINKATGSAIEKVKGRNETEVENVPGVGLVVVDKTTKTKKVLQGTKGTDFKTFGTAETGQIAVDFNRTDENGNFVKTQLTEGVKPEVFQKIDELLIAQKALRDPMLNKNSDDYKSYQTVVKTLTRDLFDTSEFENVVNSKGEAMRSRLLQAGLNDTDAEKLIMNYKEDAYDDFITKSSTSTTTYNPSESMDKVFAKSLEKLITDTRKDAQGNAKIASFAEIFKEGSKNFRTGTFASARLTIGKLLNASPTLNEAMEKAIGADQLKSFIGGDIAVGETLNKIGAQFAVTFASNFPGNLNQSEVDLIKEAGLQLSTTPKGIALMEKIFRQASERSTAELALVEKQMQDPKLKGLKPEDRYIAITSAIDKMRKEKPLVTPEIISELKGQKAEEASGFYFADKNTGENMAMTVTPPMAQKAQIIFSEGTEDNFIKNKGDEFLELLKKQQPNKRFSEENLRQFYRTYKKYDFRKRGAE